MQVNLVTDRGSQFTGSYWAQQCKFYNINHSTMVAYNLQANSLVERWHCVLKDTLKATANEHQDWADRLPILLLGLRAQPSSDSSLSPHQMVFGTEPYLCADFISRDTQEMGDTGFYEKLQKARQGYVYPDPTTNRLNESAASKDLMTAAYVLIRAKGHIRPLDQRYKGTYKVVSQGPESFVLVVSGKQDKFPIHRLKPYFCQEEPEPSPFSPQRSRTPDSSAPRTTPTETPTSPLAFYLEADFSVVRSLRERPARTPRARSCKPKRGHYWSRLF